ncbi:hypothetical protein Leryth_017666 [Lithospermum erythrorhizon]|nr:hypothetical protein Leryth_017666 [Lithospermum erythrorhizon]
MANLISSAMVVTADSEQERKHMLNSCMSSPQAPPQQVCDLSNGPVAILWDIENCPVPSDVRSDNIAGNIRMALRVHPVIKGAVTLFSAYGDFNAFPRRLREGCQRTGVKLVDVPNGRKDAADKAILVDMFLFALDNPPPSTIMLISGDVDFAPALHILGQRGYTVILAIPSNTFVSSALSNAGRFVWDWPSVARGEGFVPHVKALGPPCEVPGGSSSHLRKCEKNEISDNQTEEEAIVYRGRSQNYDNTWDCSMVSQSLSEYNGTSISQPCSIRSHSLPSGMNEVSARNPASGEQNDLMFVQPGDVSGLKGQLVKLLELSGGCLPLSCLPAEYQKLYGRPLYMSEYGASKLVNLLKKMSDTMAVGGKGQKRFVYLLKSRTEPNSSPSILLKGKKTRKDSQKESSDTMARLGSSDESSDYEKVVFEERTAKCDAGRSLVINQNLEKFKYELQEILVSYSCRIFVGCFEAVYQQRHKRPLEYKSLGVNVLEELLGKMKDVVTLQEEPCTRKKYMVAVGS